MCSLPYTSADLAPSAMGGEQIVVPVGGMRLSARGSDRLVTYALGSCLGIAVHDPVAGIGGLLHVMLPESRIDPAKASVNPFMFVDVGVPLLFHECYRHGARKERLAVTIAGGAATGVHATDDHFQIGRRNLLMLRRLFWRNGVLVRAEDVGGVQTARTMLLDVGSGAVTLRVNGRDSRL